MTDWMENLPTLDLDAIKPVFDELAGARERRRPPVGRRSQARQANGQGKSCSTPGGCRTPSSTSADCPSRAKPSTLSRPSGIRSGTSSRRPCTLPAPATIAYLGVATLGFSKQNLDELLAETRRRPHREGGLPLLGLLQEQRTGELRTLGPRTDHPRPPRCGDAHPCEDSLDGATDGRAFVVESSANLRSCSSIEQITHDA